MIITETLPLLLIAVVAANLGHVIYSYSLEAIWYQSLLVLSEPSLD